MAVYLFSQQIADRADCIKNYKEQMLGEISAPVKYIFDDIPDKKDIDTYKKAGIVPEQIIAIYQYFTDNHKSGCSIRTRDKLEELENCLQATGRNERETEIQLLKDGSMVAAILLEENKEYFWGIRYFKYGKLLRMELYTDTVSYVNYYVTAKSEHGLYARLARRTFHNSDGSAAYDQIFEGEKEWFLFPDGKRYTKPQLITEFIKKLNLSAEDTVILDRSVPHIWIQGIFTYGKAARIVVLNHAGRSDAKDENGFYHWFPFSESIDTMIVSSEVQKKILMEDLKKYHCKVPVIKIAPIDGAFGFTALYESYQGKLALSWTFRGKPDGFRICDTSGARIYETANVQQHYFLIEGYEKNSGFVLKAYADTSKGKIVIAESDPVFLSERQYEKPRVSLVIPAYNAEAFIARTIDNALAQSFADLEIIVVDDGSTDSTLSIIEWYAKNFVNVLGIHQENSGNSAARDKGIEYAKGEYIGFLNQDAMLPPDKLTDMYHSENGLTKLFDL